MEFFIILLPGAMLTWLLMGEVGPVLRGDRYAEHELETQGDFLMMLG